MRGMQEGQAGAFPDTYMACDVYYLETVQDLFEQGTHVSDTDIVIVVQPGNPKSIESLEDLTREGVRVALGQPQQCTIGVLSRRLLEDAGIYDGVRENLVQETPTSAMLVPNITTGSADAVLAYRTDTLAEQNRLEVIPIDSPLSKAVQPFSIARSSDHKYLAQRLFDLIARSREKFESAGFNWRLDGVQPSRAAAEATDNPAS
jgi:ABC-type molybdate transport system substrate-binding protein